MLIHPFYAMQCKEEVSSLYNLILRPRSENRANLIYIQEEEEEEVTEMSIFVDWECSANKGVWLYC